MLYVDASTWKPKEVELKVRDPTKEGGGGGKATKDASAMDVWQGGKAMRVHCITSTAAEWEAALEKAKQVTAIRIASPNRSNFAGAL